MPLTRTFFLSSAAALVGFSTANAADAIVAAEPEPMNYVQVCDAYGSGYFYIPGTETCMKIFGHVEYKQTYKFETRDSVGTFGYQLNFDTKNDSEYGDVYSRIRFKGNSNNNNDMDVDVVGYFGIGGLELGLFTDQWSRFLLGGGYTVTNGYFGDETNQYVSYEAEFGSASLIGAIDWLAANKAGYMIGGKYNFGSGWRAAGGFGYDDNVDGYTFKAALVGKVDSLRFKLMALYANKKNHYNSNKFKGFSVLGSAQYQFTDAVSVNATAQWMESEGYLLVGNVTWDVADGFTTIAEVDYESDRKITTGLLRLRRSF